MKRFVASWMVVLLVLLAWGDAAVAQRGELPIGQIQGESDESPYRNQVVAFRGVVTGIHEDQNTRGIVYYTLFVQALPGEDDANPGTSDALPVFVGREQPRVAVGSLVRVVGQVTEFYGFTEIDDDNLSIVVEATDQPLPEPMLIEPPADNGEQLAYLEAFEGMRVTLGETVRVMGPSHVGCGFAVWAGAPTAADALERVARREAADPVGRVIPVLYSSDVDCRTMPQVKAGDLISGVTGPLIYNFDQFKILLDDPDGLVVDEAALPPAAPLSDIGGEQVRVATFNLEDYFDTNRDTALDGEPVLLPEEVALRREKLAATISTVLRCPTLVGVQEVEHAALLLDLAGELGGACGFVYEVTHEESPDGRGIDNALLSDPQRVTVVGQRLHQVCSPVPTQVVDASISCPDGESPLFGRPPLQVDLTIDGRPHTVFVNHFKSKRGGEAETALERLAQGRYQNALAGLLLDADPAARLIVLGDFNDNEGSASRRAMVAAEDSGRLSSGLAAVPDDERYSYNFGGVVELLDDILLSPELAASLHEAGVVHTNTDFPYEWRWLADEPVGHFRASDHDVGWIILYAPPAPTATPPPTASAVRPTTPAPTVTASPVARAASAEIGTATPDAVAAVAEPTPQAAQLAAHASGRRPSLWPWAALSAALAAGLLTVYWLRQRS